VAAPPAVNVAEFPEQIEVGFETAVTVGVGRTTKLIVLVAVHEPVVPVTVYIVVTVGDTEIEAPVKFPGFQV